MSFTNSVHQLYVSSIALVWLQVFGKCAKKSYKKAFNFSCASFSGAAHVIRLLEETKTLQCSVSILDYKCVPTKQLRRLTAGM